MGAERWPALLSRAEAAEYLGCSATTVSRLKAIGHLHTVSVRGLIKFRRAELDAFIESLPYADGKCPANDLRLNRSSKSKTKSQEVSA